MLTKKSRRAVGRSSDRCRANTSWVVEHQTEKIRRIHGRTGTHGREDEEMNVNREN